MPRKMSPDYWLFLVVHALHGRGVVLVYTASAIHAPHPIRDAVYRVIARRRHAVCGSADACRLATPEHRGLILD